MDIKNNVGDVISDVEYNTLKILYTLTKTSHFIHNHAIQDALKIKDTQLHMLLENLNNDLKKHIVAIKKLK